MGYRVIANDWEPYSYYINSAYISQNKYPEFEKLGGVDAAFDALNSLPPVKGYIATYYCPEDDEAPRLDRERMFYTQENGRRIDAIRERIQEWRCQSVIDEAEEAVLLSSLIFQAAYCSNTSGVFKGFHRGWGGATKTAWYRIRSRLTISPPLLFDNGQENLVAMEDANKLAAKAKCDIAYIDPPYNQHQYGSNYHMLNTVALWDKPEVNRHFSEGGKRSNKSAIRQDWRISRRSHYCYKSTASDSFRALINALNAEAILVSYSTDGIVPMDTLLETLSDKGALRVLPRRYKRYRVSSQRPSPRPHTVEFVAIVDCCKRPDKSDIDEALKQITKVET
jgi:adenine-specific DNA-methyltransferase